MLLQALFCSKLEEVYLHASGNYMGYKFCGNVSGDETASGEIVTVNDHTVWMPSPLSLPLLPPLPSFLPLSRTVSLTTHPLCVIPQAKLKPGKCSPAMMVGYPYSKQSPRDFTTKPSDLKVHWDGLVWCP